MTPCSVMQAMTNLYGGTENDILDGGLGDDMLDGEAGADIMKGGAGDDLYYVDGPSDKITELAGAGIDAVFSTVDEYVMAAEVEILFLDGGASEAIGNTKNNIMFGNPDDTHCRSYLAGMGGNDILFGEDGRDWLEGGAGDDELYGGDGDDAPYAGSGHGRLVGGAGNDILDGELGADFMQGDAGNDTYYVDNINDSVNEEKYDSHYLPTGIDAGGIDTIVSAINFDLQWYGGRYVENLILDPAGTTNTEGSGNRLNNTITGNDLGNLLYGDDGNDFLYGGIGNDIFDKDWERSNGIDLMYGWEGDDLYLPGFGRRRQGHRIGRTGSGHGLQFRERLHPWQQPGKSGS